MSKRTPLALQASIRSAETPDDCWNREPMMSTKVTRPLLQTRSRTPRKKQHIANNLQQRRKPPCLRYSSGLETLPADILYLIAAMLPSEASYALSLTSKTMSCFFDHENLLSKDPLAKKRFLLCMENYRPDYLLCYTCDRLYRWRAPGEKKPRLCPGREFIPHHDYGRLDIKQHNRRIPRESIDLALRGGKKGVHRRAKTKLLVKSLQEKESIDRYLRMKAQSHVMTTIMDDCMLVTMEFGVRIPLNDPVHPLRWLAVEAIADNDSVKPLAREFRLSRVSSVTRGLGCNFHELLILEDVRHGTESIFFACQDCKTSMRIARSILFGKWANLNIKTTQAFGSRVNLLGDKLYYTGFNEDHRKEYPDEVMHFMSCSTPVTAQPTFLLNSSEMPPGGSSDHDLSLNAWFNRHVHSYTQRIWPETRTRGPEDEVDDDDDDEEEEQEESLPPLFSDEEWSAPKPKEVSCKSLGFRKQWFPFALAVPALCLIGPVEIYRGIKKRLTASLENDTTI